MSPIRRLALLLAAESVALLVLGGWYGGLSLSREGDHTPALLAAGGALLGAVVLGVLARAVGRGLSWARTPAVVLNVFPLPIALDALQAGAWWVGLSLLLIAGAVLYLFATPELREAFRERR